MENLDLDDMFLVCDSGGAHCIADGKYTQFLFSSYKFTGDMDKYLIRYCVPYNIFLRIVYIFLQLFLRQAHPVFRSLNKLKIKWVVRVPSCDYLSLPFDTRMEAVNSEVRFLLEEDTEEFKKGLRTIKKHRAVAVFVELFHAMNEHGVVKKMGNVYFVER